MSRVRMMWIVGAMVVAMSGTAFAAGFVEDFSTDPISGGRATVAGPGQSRDSWLDPAAAFVPGTGTLTQNLCSNWRMSGGNVDTSNYIADGSTLNFALGKTYTQNDSFSFGATFQITSDGFYSTGYMQMNFGLTNSATTGMDRSSSMTTGGDTYDSIEWDFFPDANDGGYPTAQHVIFGSQDGATTVFNRIGATFGSLLPQNPGSEYGLPLDTWMTVTVSYDGSTRTLSGTVVATSSGNPLVTSTTEPDVVLAATWSDSMPANFAVDSFSLMNYQDGWGFGFMPSLLGTVTYDNVWFEEAETPPAQPVAEPSGVALLMLGAAGLASRRRR